jgi:hypothetical protein
MFELEPNFGNDNNVRLSKGEDHLGETLTRRVRSGVQCREGRVLSSIINVYHCVIIRTFLDI